MFHIINKDLLKNKLIQEIAKLFVFEKEYKQVFQRTTRSDIAGTASIYDNAKERVKYNRRLIKQRMVVRDIFRLLKE